MTSDVLVGGHKPEEIISEHLHRQEARLEERRRIEEAARNAASQAPNTNDQGAGKDTRGQNDAFEAARRTAGNGTANTNPLSARERFDIVDILKTQEGNYTFVGLDTPMGRWDLITLGGTLLDYGAKKTCDEWLAYSNTQPEFHVSPMRVRYWMMREVMELAAIPDPRADQIRTILELRTLFLTDMHVENTDNRLLTHNADVISYKTKPTVSEDDEVNTFGWPKIINRPDHPFTTARFAPIAGPSPIPMRSGYGIGDGLYAVLGDHNPERAATVIRWYLGEIVPWPEVRAREFSSFRASRCALLYSGGASSKVPVVSLDNRLDEVRLVARGVKADPADFYPHITPQGNTPQGGVNP